MSRAIDLLLLVAVAAMFANWIGAVSGAYPWQPFLVASVVLALLAGVLAISESRR